MQRLIGINPKRAKRRDAQRAEARAPGLLGRSGAVDGPDVGEGEMSDQQKIIYALIERHAQKARESEYDRSVAIAATSASREIAMAVPRDLEGKAYAARVLSELSQLMARYHDPDGEYTSGKGVIGALLDDLRVALKGDCD